MNLHFCDVFDTSNGTNYVISYIRKKDSADEESDN